MRSVWIALALIVVGSLLGAVLLWRVVDRANHPKPQLAPRGARVLEERPLGERKVVTWQIGGHVEEPSTGLYGVTIWQGKRRLYEQRAAPGTSDIRVETGDFSGDGRADVLLFEDHDGSRRCGLYRALVSKPSSIGVVASRELCADEGSFRLQRGGLVIRLSGQRPTVRRWNGHRLVVVPSSS